MVSCFFTVILWKHWKLILEIGVESIRAGLNVNFNIQFSGSYVDTFDLFGLWYSLLMSGLSFKLFHVQVARCCMRSMNLFVVLNYRGARDRKRYCQNYGNLWIRRSAHASEIFPNRIITNFVSCVIETVPGTTLLPAPCHFSNFTEINKSICLTEYSTKWLFRLVAF